MSFAPPVGGFAPPQAQAARTDRPRALPGLAVLMILTLLGELGILAFDFSRQGAGYVGTALGISFARAVQDAPVGFFGGSFATCVALVVLIIGAFAGAHWARPAGTVLMLTSAYGSLSTLIPQLTGSGDSRHAFAVPVLPNLVLNLEQIAEIVMALVFALVVLATRGPRATGAPLAFAAPQPGYGRPVPPQPSPGYPAPPVAQPGYAPAPLATPAPTPAPTPTARPHAGFGPPPPPAQPPAGYGYPPRPEDGPRP